VQEHTVSFRDSISISPSRAMNRRVRRARLRDGACRAPPQARASGSVCSGRAACRLATIRAAYLLTVELAKGAHGGAPGGTGGVHR